MIKEVKIKDEHIRLGQAMKLGRMVGSGVEAKMLIQDGQVRVNGQVELKRGKKLFAGDVVSYQGEEIKIAK